MNGSDEANPIPAAVAGRGAIGRGMGRSYGDAAQYAGGNIVSSVALNRILSVDRVAGTVTCEAGVSLDALLRFLVPRGWFPTVIPGTSFVSVGGAIAADIHGKFRHGSFCDYVESAKLVTPARGTITIDARTTPDEYWATAGGMGLTGIVAEATLRLHRIETSQMVGLTAQNATIAEGLAKLMARQLDMVLDRMAARIGLSATGRFYRALLHRADTDGWIRPAPVLSALAISVNTTRETGSRALAALIRRGIVERSDDGLRIVSKRMLEELVV